MADSNPAAAFAATWKTPELRSKIGFTLLALLIYRIGGHITAPGIDVRALLDFFQNAQGGGAGALALYDLFVGGGLSKATVFALGIVPYISASIVLQVMGPVIPQLEKMQREEEGRKRITEWTRYLTLGIAIVQAYAYSVFVAGLQGAVRNPGLAFNMEMVLFLATGAVFVMWLGEQITERGIGNGASLLIFFSIVERIWPSIGQTWSFISTGAVSTVKLILLGVVMVFVVGFTVAITVAARRVPIQIPQRTMARGRQRESAKNFIPLRLNAANVMPIIFAQTVVVIPGLLSQAFKWAWLQNLVEYLQPGAIWYFIVSAALILFFTYFYTSIIFNPVDIAENLKKQGAFIPGVKAGAKTADYITRIVERITFPGALFLTFIALMPIVISDAINVPFRFGGTSLLIVVGVGLDTLAQLQQHLLLRKYDTFMKKGRVKFRGRQGGAF